MASKFKRIMEMAERRANGDTVGASAARLKEIMEIVARHEIAQGLTPEKAVAILQELGPTFVKLGQIASTHPDILPLDYCDAFGRLRAHVDPMPTEVVRNQVESELGRPLDDIFSEFDEVALGSASIGQVHRAVIRESGQEVAVKVQRPGIVETVTEDLALMKRLVNLQGLIMHGDGQISFKEFVDELERTSRDELDFTIEADNLTRFHTNNVDRERVTSPRCYRDYCTSGILVEDFVRGPRVGAIDDIEGMTPEKRESIGYLIANNYVVQVLQDGFFHADPHAGNILLDVEGNGIEWIDFGMMGSLTMQEREVLRGMVDAIAKQDAYALKRNLLKMATPTGPIDHGELLGQCEDMLGRYVNVDLESFDTGKLFEDLMDTMSNAGFKIDPALVMLGRGLVTLEGTIRLVSSKINIMDVLARYIADSFDPQQAMASMQRLAGKGIDSVEALTQLPSKATETLDMMQKGHLKLHMDLGAEDRLADSIKMLVNRLVLTLIAVTFFLGSCMLCMTGLQPIVLGVPLIALVGFVTATVLMGYIVIDMLRKK